MPDMPDITPGDMFEYSISMEMRVGRGATAWVKYGATIMAMDGEDWDAVHDRLVSVVHTGLTTQQEEIISAYGK